MTDEPLEIRGITRHHRFHRRLALFGLLVALIPTLTVALVAYRHERGLMVDGALERLDAVASAQAARLTDHIDTRLQMLSLVSSRTQLRISLAEHLQTGDSEPREVVEQIIGDARDATTDVFAIHIADTQGRVIASTEEGTRGASTARWGIAEGVIDGPTIGPVVTGAAGAAVLVLADPLALGGETIGVALLETSLTRITALANDYTGLGASGETQIAGPGSDGTSVFIAPLRFDLSAVLEAVSESPMTAALNGSTLLLTDAVDYRNQKVFAATRFVERAGWGVVVKIDAAEALRPVDDLARYAITAVLAAALMAAALAWLAARSIARPIERMTETAIAITEGSRDLRVDEDRSDELGSLAIAFNDMTDELTQHAEAREQLIASVSHELRTPLTAVVGYAEVLLAAAGSLGDEERQEMLTLVVEQGRDLTDLIQDLLVAAGSGPSDASVTVTAVDLGEAVASVLEAAAPGNPEAHAIAVSGSALALGDPVRVRQILRNLVSNTLRYGGGNRRIELATQGPSAIVRVIDGGAGVDPGQEEAIFDPYVRTRSVPGITDSVGLGLTVSRRLARLMSGDITFARESNESVFTLTLPRHSQ